jgi:hypothetical protein
LRPQSNSLIVEGLIEQSPLLSASGVYLKIEKVKFIATQTEAINNGQTNSLGIH